MEITNFNGDSGKLQNYEYDLKLQINLQGHYYYLISIWSGLLAMICGLSLYIVSSPVIHIFIPL